MLAHIPFQLGFHPTESIVLVSLRPPEAEVGLVARMDVEAFADVDDGPMAARAFVDLVRADGAGSVFVAVFTRSPVRSGGVDAARARTAIEQCREEAEAAFGPVEVWVVAPWGYADLDCRDASCCPPGGRDPRELAGGLVGAEMVLRGLWAADDREEWSRLPEVSPAARRESRAVARARRPGSPGSGAETDPDWRRGAYEAWTTARGRVERGVGIGPVEAGAVGAGLGSIAVRDAVLLSLLPGTQELVARTLAGGDVDAATGEAIASVVDPRMAVAPPSEIDAARGVLELVAAHGEGEAAALTLLGFVAWWRGQGALAGERLRAALRADPAYRLALLLDGALRAGVPPGWVRASV